MSTNNVKKEKSDFVEIRDVLKNEVQRFSSINSALVEGTSEFNKIDEIYNTYGSQIDVSKNHILQMKRREFFENMFIYIGMVIYFLCVAYVMLKRFPIHRILFIVLYIIEFIFSIIVDCKEYLLINLVFKNITYTIDNSNFTNYTSNIQISDM